jgi:endonuclease/exonuclease/phosphatase family metal-dependent hydrolase
MTRITSYNILAGGYDLRKDGFTQRTQPLTSIIRTTQPDVVGLAEAINPAITQRPFVIEEIARALDMQLVLGTDLDHCDDFQTALLTKLPVVYKKIHSLPGLLMRPLLEVCVEEANGQQLVLFVTHLTAAFNKGWAGNAIRMREMREILRIMAQVQDKPHAIMGDFNSMAPSDPFKASFLLRYLVQVGRKQQSVGIIDGQPYLDAVVPKPLRILIPLLQAIPKSTILSNLFDLAASFYAPRGPIAQIQDAGYVDTYRHLHPDTLGFTCPSAAPAGRIDFIFANPVLAERLETCEPILEGDGFFGSQASDHLAVSASFGLAIKNDDQGIRITSAAHTL